MFDSLYEQRVPKMWSFAYKSIKPLGNLPAALSRCNAALCRLVDARSHRSHRPAAVLARDHALAPHSVLVRRWADRGPPRVFWLSGFTFPTGFLTALMQVSFIFVFVVSFINLSFEVLCSSNGAYLSNDCRFILAQFKFRSTCWAGNSRCCLLIWYLCCDFLCAVIFCAIFVPNMKTLLHSG